MPYVLHVKKARKARRKEGIKRGDEYWMVSQRISGRFVRKYFKRKPKPSELTTSEFWRTIYQLQEYADEKRSDSFEAFNDAHDHVETTLGELKDDQQEKFDNLPDSLQASASGERLQERIDALEEAISNLPGELDDETNADLVEAHFDHLDEILSGISCD